jgi:tRNA (guanine-N7-)-methyltransferase
MNTESAPPESGKPLRSYGRIKARSLKPRQAALLESMLPGLAIDPAAPPAADALEIGFGAGEHLTAQALARPDWRFIGVEPFLNGMGACLAQIEAKSLANVRLHNGDARDVVAGLPPASLQRVWVLFPDPWPKARHWKRRLMQPEFITALARVLAPGGELRFATDWKAYAAWTLESILAERSFEWPAATASDWRQPWRDHVPTRYEQKRLGDCAPVFLRFVRR